MSGRRPWTCRPSVGGVPRGRGEVRVKVGRRWINGRHDRRSPTRCRWTPGGTKPLDPAKGPFTWTVQAVDANGHVSPADVRRVDLLRERRAPPTTGAAPLTPLTPAWPPRATARFPELTWEPVDGAAYYKVTSGDAEGHFFETVARPPEQTFPYPAATDIRTDVPVTGSLRLVRAPPTVGRLPHRATRRQGHASRSQTLAPATGQQIALDGSGLDARHGSCDAVLDDPATSIDICTGVRDHTGPGLAARCPTPALHDLPVAGPRVHEPGPGSKSRPSTIPTTVRHRGGTRPWLCRTARQATPTTGSSARARPTTPVRPRTRPTRRLPTPSTSCPTAVELHSPAAGRHRGQRRDVHVEGLPGHQPASTNVNPTTGEKSGQAAEQLPDPGVHELGVQPRWSTRRRSTRRRTPPFNKTYPEGELYWRVQAVDGAGNGLAWSPRRGASPRQVPDRQLQSPANESTVTAAPAVPVEARCTSPASYDIEVYKNADKTALVGEPGAERDHSKQVGLLAADPARGLVDGPTCWRVRRVDADGKKGDWSGWSWFKVTGSAPELVAPASSMYTSASDSLFTWRAVTGASSYRFERRSTGSTSIDETVTTAASRGHRRSTIPNGHLGSGGSRRYDASKQPLRQLGVADLLRRRTRPAVVGKSPVTTASRTTNFVAKFSEPVRDVNGTSDEALRQGAAAPAHRQGDTQLRPATATLEPGQEPSRRQALHGSGSVQPSRTGRATRLPATAWSATAK